MNLQLENNKRKDYLKVSKHFKQEDFYRTPQRDFELLKKQNLNDYFKLNLEEKSV